MMTSKDFGKMTKTTIYTNGKDFIVEHDGYMTTMSIEDYAEWGGDITLAFADGGELVAAGVQNDQ